ncbi:DNA-binding FadR family transcriptional regulator [Mucilaginibacter frigoritolerans]|jgi:DNA-binding FadR family transcriptional regulator|uniref:DNA-binding FadR family transcriptional regulator n=1 Tax=Mucilaginibacter frigoritolerans TaxID=652788 RepID=A0A562TNC9_9SPHI|nr:FadR/GntR family transcriptional regulator [Mucilaginibacter frigoritolerans]TWI94784.1 DNA-binding FadR family transcriptional regulator [Mucilaginibacter frigoritolerans]
MEKERLSDLVATRIRQDIQEGKYKAGEKIPAEPELMKIYTVGRSSIREAVKSLAITGTLEVKQGDGTYIRQVGQDVAMDQRLRNADFDEINAVRILLEEEIIRLAAEHRTADDLKVIANHLADRKQAIMDENREACTNADIAFHSAIADASGNAVLAGLYQSFTQTIRTFFAKREIQGIGHFAMSHHLHENLYNAILGKRKKQALDIIRYILNNNY